MNDIVTMFSIVFILVYTIGGFILSATIVDDNDGTFGNLKQLIFLLLLGGPLAWAVALILLSRNICFKIYKSLK